MMSCENWMFGGCDPIVDDPCSCCGERYAIFEEASLDERMCREMGVVSQGWLIDMSLFLEREVMVRNLMVQKMDELRNMHIDRCHEMIQLEFGIADLKANIDAKIGTLEWVPQKEGVEVDIEEIVVICNQAKPIKIQDVTIEEMLLKLQEKAKNILYSNFSTFGDESVHLKAMNDEIQCKGLVTLSRLRNGPQRKNDAKLGKEFKSSKWRDRVRLLMLSYFPHAYQQKIELKLGRQFVASKWKYKG